VNTIVEKKMEYTTSLDCWNLNIQMIFENVNTKLLSRAENFTTQLISKKSIQN